MRDPHALSGGDALSLPPLAEIEHADWPSLQRMCETMGLNPKGRSAVVRMRVMDHVRRRVRVEPWRPGRSHVAALLTHLGFPEAAETAWESTVRLDAPAPWLGLGHAELAGGRLAEAAKAFTRAAQMGDSSAELHKAEALIAGGDYAGAAQACDTYLAAHPGDLRALATKASFLERAGFGDEAIKVIQSAVGLHPEFPALAQMLGIARLRSGHYAAAVDELSGVVQQKPKDLNARANLGAALILGGRTRDAITSLRDGLKPTSLDAEALNNLGVAYLALGRIRSAAANLERAVKRLETPRILLNLGVVQERDGELEKALGTYEQVLRLRPQDPEAIAARKRLASQKSVGRPALATPKPRKRSSEPSHRAPRSRSKKAPPEK